MTTHRLTPEQMASIRERATATASKRVASEVGELILARESTPDTFDSLEQFEAYATQVRDDESAHERNWVASYMLHYFRAFAYYCAFEVSGADEDFAKRCVRYPEVVSEIAERVQAALERT